MRVSLKNINVFSELPTLTYEVSPCLQRRRIA
jgi:hypothetical protein